MKNDNGKSVKIKKSGKPEGYIGRPRPMRMRKIEFKKPGVKFYVEAGILLCIAAFLFYIGWRLANSSKPKETNFVYHEFDASKHPSSYVLENSFLRFELDPETTQFTLLQKSTGHLWRSNPENPDQDRLALGKERNNMKSLFLLKYSTENGVDDIYDSYSYSVQKKFYDIERNGDEIVVNYCVGQIERTYIYPLAITESDMDEWLDLMKPADARAVKQVYRKIDIDNLLPSDNSADLLMRYPVLEDDNVYEIRDNIQKYLKERTEQLFMSVGYTEADYRRDAELYAGGSVKEVPMFNVSVSYRLDGGDFVVNVPFDRISYRESYPVTNLTLLPFFGAAGTGDDGFIFVPEGGGSLIEFNNGKTKQSGYYADIYGWDYALDRKAVIAETRIAFPVYGMSFGDSSFIAVIKNGAEYAGITADISGKMGSWNYVRPDFRMIHGEQYEVSTRTTSAQYAYEDSLPQDESITEIFRFVDGGSYVDMAKSYREYLFGDSARTENASVPVAVEVIGAVDKVQQVAGIPETRPYKLTSYSEAAEIVNQISEYGIDSLYFKLSGFINGGIRQKMLTKIKYISQLGGKGEFRKMMDSMSSSGARIYLDGTVQYAYRSSFSDGFNRYKHPARFVSSEVCEISEYSPVWYGKLDTRDTYYLLRPDISDRLADVFVRKAKSLGLDGVSFRDNGWQLSADYNDDRPVSRAASRKIQTSRMQSVNDMGMGVMVNSGNDYSLKNADFVTGMVLHGNNYAIIDRQVPFYQIALHGYVNFAGTPVNLAYENRQIILEAAESGAGLYFVFMNESEKALQETNYTEYYAACFDSWKEQMDSICRSYDSAMSAVRNSCIDGHFFVTDDVTLTTFDNGIRVYVNFGYSDFTTESGLLVPARDYKVIGGGI